MAKVVPLGWPQQVVASWLPPPIGRQERGLNASAQSLVCNVSVTVTVTVTVTATASLTLISTR